MFGRQRFVTIGPHGVPWTPELARKEAKRLLGLVANGKDSVDEKAKARLQRPTHSGNRGSISPEPQTKAEAPTNSEIERYLLASWRPLHPCQFSRITRRHLSARIADLASAHGAISAARCPYSPILNAQVGNAGEPRHCCESGSQR
ncbi:Arm DNA-binding domain-containing protein [Bradyrhizobium sp. SSUT77]|nr:Arm DNA-binding domain-containing protein [Bradyrhizobium sp. SSUT77]MDH2348140.1 Arm DNA-binding domain-containing protein [Bradyrhizobium sp. SSUT77]